MKPVRSSDASPNTIKDQDIQTKNVRRRAFMKAIGGGTFLLAAGAVTAAGCSKRSDTCRNVVDANPTDPVSGRLVCDGD